MAPYYGADHDLDSKMCQKTARIFRKQFKLIPDLMNQVFCKKAINKNSDSFIEETFDLS